jgi:hypothetical protein
MFSDEIVNLFENFVLRTASAGSREKKKKKEKTPLNQGELGWDFEAGFLKIYVCSGPGSP